MSDSLFQIQHDKPARDASAWMQHQIARLCADRLNAIIPRLEAEAEDLLALGVPLDQITRLVWHDGREEMAAMRTDYER